MSDFFRIPADPSLVAMTTRQLAAKVHAAEDANDDITMMQVWAELDRREATYPRIAWTETFRQHYIDLHRTRGTL